MSLDKYGYFTDDGKEFVITRPDTPAPWVNYISNGKYTGLVTNSGGGFSYWLDPRNSRITRLRYNGMPWDRPGRYVYLKDEDNSYWSLSWQPTAHKLDFYECRVGLGYQIIKSSYKDIESEITYFVPQDEPLEIWLVRIKNNRNKNAKFNVYSYSELCLGHALIDLINQPNDQHFNIANFSEEDNAVYATKNYWVTYSGATVKQPNKAWDRYVFFTSDLKVDSWDCLKDAFIGNWRSEQNPIGIENKSLSNTNITAGDACSALQSEIELEVGEEKEFVVLMGCVEAKNYKSQSQNLISKYRDPQKSKLALLAVKKYWDEYLSTIKVNTPDNEMNKMLNVWGMRQSWVTFNANRNAGYYHGGLLFGVGVRDQCQDMMGPLLSEPKLVKERYLEVVSHQFEKGNTLHNYFKLTGQGEVTGHSDTPLWLPFALFNYIKETGDLTILSEEVPFQDSENTANLLEHNIRAVDYVISQLTENYLPLFGPGDWNDTLDYVGREGKGISVWVAHFLCYILKEFCTLLKFIDGKTSVIAKEKLSSKIDEYKDTYKKVADAVNNICWDGKWYIRGIKDNGGLLGSSSNEEGKIFMNAQSWAVISGVANDERAKTAMDSADELLTTSRGPKILSPSYTKVDETIGLATRCVAGKKENGAIFNHVASWAILANTLIGEGNRAYDYYKKTMPINQAFDPDIYKMEPYVYSEYVTSDDHPTFGQASHSWLTGSGVWMFRDGIDYILGVRPTYDGLMIAPCIPDFWKEYNISRKFRGAIYNITVKNPDSKQFGVKSIFVDGKKIEGNILPIYEKGKMVDVEVTMG
ncbi:MAG: glycosyl transferase family 36 [Armatimonadota bacterium]